ncbi:hypothetical protein ACLOJK_007663 [Asimina triloba]
MDHHRSGTKCFLLRPHLAIHFPKSIYRHFWHQQAPHQQIHAVHHVYKIEPIPKLSGPRPTNGEDCLPMLPHDARSSHLIRMLLDRTRRPPTQPLPDATASLARCQHDAAASLARCQLPAILHVGKVGMGVSRPQRTTAMPTSHAATATVPAPLQCSIRIAYK